MEYWNSEVRSSPVLVLLLAMVCSLQFAVCSVQRAACSVQRASSRLGMHVQHTSTSRDQ